MARRATSVCIPVSARAVVEFYRYPARTPILSIRAGQPAALVILTLPDHIAAGHVEFARQLATLAAQYAIEVERSWRGLPALVASQRETSPPGAVDAA